MLVILLVTLATLAVLYVKWKLGYWKRAGVPGPEPTFLFGNIAKLLILKDNLGYMAQRWYNDHPTVPYVGYYNALKPGIVLRDSDLIKDVLIKDHSYANENETMVSEIYDPLSVFNPFFTTGEEWKRQRSVFTFMVTAAKLKTIVPQMESSCKKLIEHLKSLPAGTDFEAKSISAKFTTQNVTKLIFSVDADCFGMGRSEFRDFGKNMFKPSLGFAFKVTFGWYLLPKWLSKHLPFPFVSPEASEWFLDFLRQNEESRKTIQSDDMFQSLLLAKEKLGLSDLEVGSNALSTFIDGYETSSTAMAWVLYDLAGNSDIQERLHEEVVEVWKRNDKKLSLEMIQEMTYMDSVICESMRLNPVGISLGKICTKPYQLPIIDGQSEPVTIYPGTPMQIPVRAIHLDPEIYPDPEVFDPARFTEEERKNRHKAHYLPFGEGPRMCPGMRLAIAQIKAAIIYVVKDFKIQISSNHKPIVVDILSPMGQPKDGLLLSFAPRTAE